MILRLTNPIRLTKAIVNGRMQEVGSMAIDYWKRLKFTGQPYTTQVNYLLFLVTPGTQNSRKETGR